MLYFKIIFIDYKSDIQKIVNIYIYGRFKSQCELDYLKIIYLV